VSAGLGLPVIGALLGHTTPTTTARYAHLLDDPLRDAAEKVGALLIEAEPRTRTTTSCAKRPNARSASWPPQGRRAIGWRTKS
jgi:hypothetical protein